MATNSATGDSDNECEIALEAAVGVALDHCTDDAALQENIGRVLGVEPDTNCTAALEEGLDRETCTSSRGVRQWVLCRAHDLLKSNNISFQEAMEQSWTEAAESCDMDGAVV